MDDEPKNNVSQERRIARRSAYLEKIERMFLGQFEHAIDDKGRLTIPARFREPLAGGAFITRGLDHNLTVYTAADFDALYQRVTQLSLTDQSARLLARLFFAGASPAEVDRAGRILIPQFLRSAAGLGENAMVIGVGNYFEVWAPERWALQVSQLEDSDANAERFAALNVPLFGAQGG